MDHDKPGAAQSDLPGREGQNSRPATASDRSTATNLTQVPGSQYLLTTQPHGVPALAQLSPAGSQNVPGGVTRIINITPSRGEPSPLRPSLTNQSIVNVLTKSPTLNIHNFQLIQSNDGAATNTAIATTSGAATPTHSRGIVKRSLISSPEKKDYAVKKLKVLNHKTIKSRLVQEKYDNHLAEMYLLESGGNILELVQFQRFPKNQQYLNYIREHSIDGTSTGIFIPHTTPSTPTATATSSLPGISLSNSSQLQPPTKPVPRMNQNLTSTVSPSLDVTSIKATSATSSTNQESIVEKAKQEAFVLQRIGELQKEGLWSEKRLPKVQEKQRTKAHWDFALEELMWLSTDFAQERKWKKINAKKCSRMVQKYFQEKALAAQRAEKAFEQHKKKLAAFCAKEIRNFWSNVEKLVEYRQNTILEEKRQRVIDHHLSFIVDQTEKYTRLLAEGMNKPAATVPSISNISSQRKSRAPSDDDFCPSLQSDEDDEETIEKEEAAPSNEDQSAELEALKKESQMELDDLLEDDVLVDYLLNRDNIRLSSDDSDDEMQETANATDSEEFDSVEESDTEKIEGSQTENQSIKMLLDDQKWEGEKTKTDDKNDLLNNATAIAESIQPKGNTLSSTTVSTKVPFLLQLPLREYQHIGLDWLVTMYERKLNGILADEMGLGKTIQTIALLAHLACEKGNWGPHLIIVPTSVMLNWEMECKKWCPGFKILTYYGPHKERKQKRRGWTKYNAFHICITSYKLVIQDHQSFRRKKWKYLILDEAQNIKNFKSQRWQLLLNFQSERRLLLTGTPLQNNLMELWSLMHFLMPSIFQSHREFKEWFSNPVSGMIEGNSEYNDSIIKRLHKVLRPFLLRRLKSEVEKQMPKKYEHIKMCRLSNRQRYLYDDFMSRAKTRETLASGNLLSVINVLMQLRKVCNHPNLFEVRPTLSPFQCDNIKLHIPSIVYSALLFDVLKHVNLYTLNLLILMAEFRITSSQYHRIRALAYKTGLKPPSTTNQPPPGTPPVRLRMRVVSVSQREQRPPQQPQQVSGQSISRTRVASRDSNTVVRNVGLPVLGMDVTGNSILRVTSSSGIQVASSSGMHVASSSGMQVVGSTGIQVASSSGIQVASSSGIQVVTTGVINTGMQVVTSGVVSSTMQVVSQGLVKTVPMLTFSQAAGQGLVSPINVASVLKHGDRASNYAQIVQTPTGKHLLLTSSPGSGGNSAVTHTAQKVMFLSTKQAIIPNSNSNLTSPNGNQIITRAYGRLSLTPITTNSIAPLSTAPPSGVASVRGVGPVRSTLPVSGIESTSSVASTSGIAPVRGITPLTKVGGITPITGITPIRGLAQTNKIATTSRNIHDSGAVLASSSPSTSSAPNCNTNTPQLVRERPRNPCFDFLDEIYPPKRQRVRRVSSEEEDTPDQRYRKRVRLMSRINRKRCLLRPLYGRELVDCVKITEPSTTRPWSNGRLHCVKAIYGVKPQWTPEFLKEALYTPVRRIHQLQDICDRFIIYIPSAKADDPDVRVWHPPPSEYQKRKDNDQIIQLVFRKTISPLHRIATMMVTQFPDRRLIQYDCGKLQMLDRLLRNLKVEGHRVLIFTQMTKMLDVLEAFLNFHGHIYLRLDGTTKVEQRQILMERFNSDKRIFVFILSTRSGGVGVNLTGADTVIFYDSDWNPTMDAQAQDRCHRIGQTRDVHIYRLISERTIEENILKKANQKRLLGNLAIEGGNFTTAYFKNNTTIVDLFNIDQTKDSAAQRMSELVEKRQDKETPVSDNDEDETSALENALAACEDDQDVQATKIATAEAVAELAEFDENIPLDHEEKEKEPEISKAQQTINDIIKTLTPVEKYAMQFLELTESTLSAEYLAAEERRIEEQKRIWEINQIATIKEQEEKRQREIEEENYMLTYSREDATNQVWLCENTMEIMPMWCPPTPPQQDNDIYVNANMSHLYDINIMPESQLPPVYVKKETPKRRFETAFPMDHRRPAKIPKKEETIATVPRSLFHPPTLLKLKRDLKLQKYRGLMRPTISIPGKPLPGKSSSDLSFHQNWTIHEDLALLKLIKYFQRLPLNLIVMSPGNTPNWDFAADYVNTVSITYRSPKQCRQRYEGHLMPREEGKYSVSDNASRKKKKTLPLQKAPSPTKSRLPPRTAQLYTQDNNSTFSQLICENHNNLKTIASKRIPTTRTLVNNPLMNKTKTTPILNECGIDIENPILPVEIAARRAERMAKEKKTMTPEQIAKIQLIKAGIVVSQQQQPQQQSSQDQASTSKSQTCVMVQAHPTVVAVTSTQVIMPQATIIAPMPIVTTAPGSGILQTNLRQQRIITSPLQGSNVVSVSGLTPAQLQAATQRLLVSTGGTPKAVTSTTGPQTKQFSQAQLHMIRQASIKNQLRLHTNNLVQGTKTSTVTIGGQQTVVQLTQAQPRTQFVRQGNVTVGAKTGVTRTVTESEVAQLLKKQQQLQQQKIAAGNVVQASSATGVGNTIHGLSHQVLAQAIQQAGTSGAQVTTLVKAVPSSPGGTTHTVTIPVSGVTLATPGAKAITPLKQATTHQLRQMQIQQQILAQKKLAAAVASSGQKLSITTGTAKGTGVQTTQLIMTPKQGMTVQQFQQVIRAPLNVSQGPMVLSKGAARVIPVNTVPGTKQTIQVVAASSQALSSALRPQGATTIAGIRLQGSPNTSQHAILSQVSAALNQNMTARQNNPVRLQTASGQPIMAVTVQSPSQNPQNQSPNPEQVSRYLKK
ncbi:unnamed protein product [Ceutorhynchus assimilis]|uniref:Helicase domino n=1 Tax=Ceutorhynchus assimilis TaxID=467358 RepID=A0A9N9QIJ7_9CUCU|nr:unnamed protein product [Ceutorhynchus assimilis]